MIDMIIAPSLLACNFLELGKVCEMLNESDADWYHLDVMDGRFVPNISFGIPIVEHIRKATNKVLDVHVMIEEPEKYIEDFFKAGANNYTFHIESSNHTNRTIQEIKGFGMKAGVALNPHTSISTLENIINDVDIVCLMSVNPGFGGQKFIEKTIDKIIQLKELIIKNESQSLIQIDGGVTLDNFQAILKAGADVLVAGSTVFKSNSIETIHKMKNGIY